jgi:signal transduction histidine kinase
MTAMAAALYNPAVRGETFLNNSNAFGGARSAALRHAGDKPPFRANILIVDDDTRSLFALAEVLRDERHHVVQAGSGDEALRHLLEEEFAVVLLDVHMPGLSGYETAALIRSRQRSGAVPIIFLTAYNKDEAHVFEGYDAGAVDYLFKPVDPVILKAKVAVFADLHRKAAEIERQANERLHAERALRRREEEQSLILESLPIALYKTPLAANLAAPRFVRGNIERLTGFPAERFLNGGAFWQSRLHPADRDRALGDLARIGETGSATLEYRWECADGAYRHLLDQAVLVVDAAAASGGAGTIVGTWLDVTERALLEGKLHHAQKLETLGRLTGGVAHDFNNLLTAIGGNLALIEGANDASDRVRRLALSAQRAVDRGESLARQLLTFSRRQTLHPEGVDVARHLRNMSDLLKGAVRGSVRLEIDTAEDLWPVEVDVSQLELAALNIAANARDAMGPDGGTLRIAARNATLPSGGGSGIAGSLAGEFVALSFEDTGTGMPPEALEHIFEPFFTTKEAGKGTGLGLSQVYGFATQSGGGVDVDSAVGQGTRVTIYLPRAIEAPL